MTCTLMEEQRTPRPSIMHFIRGTPRHDDSAEVEKQKLVCLQVLPETVCPALDDRACALVLDEQMPEGPIPQ